MRIFNNPVSKNVLSSVKNEVAKSFIKKGNISDKIATLSNTPLSLNPQGNYFEGLKANPQCKISGYPKSLSGSLLKVATEKAKNNTQPSSLLNKQGTFFQGMLVNPDLKILTTPRGKAASLTNLNANFQQNKPLRAGMLNRHGNLFQGHIPNPELKIYGSAPGLPQGYELDDLFIYDESPVGISDKQISSYEGDSYSDIFSNEPLFSDDNSDNSLLPAFSEGYGGSDKNILKENASDIKDYYKIYYEQD